MWEKHQVEYNEDGYVLSGKFTLQELKGHYDIAVEDYFNLLPWELRPDGKIKKLSKYMHFLEDCIAAFKEPSLPFPEEL